MKALGVARKTILEFLREPLLLGVLFGFPVLMIGFYYVAFGETEEGLAKYVVVHVVNEDDGEMGRQLIERMRGEEFEGKPVFAVSEVSDRRDTEIALREHKATVLLVIPPGFSESISAVSAGEDVPPAVVSLVGDLTSGEYVFARGFVYALLREFAVSAAGAPPGDGPPAVSYEFVPGTGTMSDFDFGVPGLIVFGIMLLAVSSAQTLVREHVNGTLRRLQLARSGAADLLGGVTLAHMAIALVMVPFTFGAAYAMGFRGNGSLLLAALIGLLLCLSAVGLGLITACFARNDGDAANISAGAGVIMVLMSGAMYPLPEAPIFTVAGFTFEAYDFLPPTPASEAMRRVLVLGDGPAAVSAEIVTLAVISALYLAAGVILYRRLRMRGMRRS